MVQLSYPYRITGKKCYLWLYGPLLAKWCFCCLKCCLGLSLLFFPRSKGLLISWLQSLSTMILEPKKIRSVTASTFSPSVCHKLMRPDAKILVFWMLSLSQLFHSPLSPWSRGSLVPLHFLPLEWYYLHIRDCWYFSQQSWFQFVIHPGYISPDVLCTEIK